MEQFKDILKAKRKDLELTQKDLAEKLGVSQQAIYKYETGSFIPSFFVVDAIADFFECSVDELVGRDYKYTPFKKMREVKYIIYDKMREHRHSYDSLAKAIECSDHTIRQWTSGKTYPDLKYLCILSDIFKCSIDELMGRKL